MNARRVFAFSTPKFKIMNKFLTTRSRTFLAFFLSVLLVLQTSSCHYFWVRNIEPQEFNSIYEIGELHKYFVLHSKSQMYELYDISVDSTAMHGVLEEPFKAVFYGKDCLYFHFPIA